MKSILRELFALILIPLEKGDGEYSYQPSHRKILIAMGVLFAALATGVAVVAQGKELGYLFPALVFGGMSAMAIIVGGLGNDRAVATLWGSGKAKGRR